MTFRPPEPRVTLVVAAAEGSGVIGANDRLPWHLPSDLARFRRLTLGRPVVVGRKTAESLPCPLGGGRTLIVLTRDREYEPLDPTAVVVHSVAQTLTAAEMAAKPAAGDGFDVMVAGGADVYRQFVPLADAVLLTLVHGEFEGDARFPLGELRSAEWEEVSRSSHLRLGGNSHLRTNFTYLRAPALSTPVHSPHNQ